MSNVRQKLLDCFNGRTSRNCEYCIAHPSRGGDCCFGVSWEENDPQCAGCIHEHACSTIVLSKDQQSQYRSYTRRVPITQDNDPLRTTIRAKTAETLRSVPAQRVEVLTEGETMLQRLAKDAAWGAMEGMTRMVYEFFRTRRWP